jgi:hypothetical protein
MGYYIIGEWEGARQGEVRSRQVEGGEFSISGRGIGSASRGRKLREGLLKTGNSKIKNQSSKLKKTEKKKAGTNKVKNGNHSKTSQR